MHHTVHYPDLAIPAHGERMTEVAAGIHWLQFPLPFALDHVNVWLLADGDGWTLVDCGVGLEETQGLWQQLIDSHLGGRPIQRIIVTHFHPDHLGHAAWLSAYFQAPVWMSDTEFGIAQRLHQREDQASGERLAEFFAAHGLDAPRTHKIATRGNRYRHLVPALPPSIESLHPGDQIAIGGDYWQVRIYGGHAPAHVCLYCAERQLLIAGDQLLPRISSNVSVYPDMPDVDPLGDFLAALADLSHLPAELRVLPSHGRVFEGAQPRIAQLQEHHQERLQALEEVCAQPCSAADVLSTLFHRPLDDHQLVFAMGEAIAHLQHLQRAGVLEQHQDGNILKFRASATRGRDSCTAGVCQEAVIQPDVVSSVSTRRGRYW